MRFTKMQGCGNDYVYIDGFRESVPDPSCLAVKMSDRHFGVGSDGLVMILPSEFCDFKMRMFNADGSESEMCGNASRCLARYVYEEGLTRKKTFTLETLAGVREISLNFEENRLDSVTVDMGMPVLESERIPLNLPVERAIGHPLTVLGVKYFFTAISMGNPHAVVFVSDVEHCALEITGPLIEKHSFFPNRTNVEFVQVIDREHLKMRVWERGAGETLACGTGACAALVAAVLHGLSDREASLILRGGDLKIHWSKENHHVYMTGNAVRVFEGDFCFL